jgi:Reeler domain/Secretion system C-terminal sorting domain
MKRVLLVGTTCLMALTMPFEARTRSSGAPAGRTGSPADGGLTCNAAGCHSGSAVNSGSGSISVVGQNTYVAGQTVPLSITVEEDGVSRIGFQVSAISDNTGAHVGTFNIVDGSQTKFASNNPNYVTHTTAPFGASSRTFEVEWVAPASHVGVVMFYISGNAANGNGTSLGDHIYTSQYPLAESATGTETEPLPSHFAVTSAYPNPVADQALVAVNLPTPDGLTVRVLDLLGREVSSRRYASLGAGSHELPVSVSGLAPGSYLVVVRSTTGRMASHQLVVTR